MWSLYEQRTGLTIRTRESERGCAVAVAVAIAVAVC
jgi:hypothetical protein